MPRCSAGRTRFVDALKRINVLPLGSGALAGTSLPVDRQYMASLLRFDAVSDNSMDSVSDRDFVLEFLSCAAVLMMHVSRMAEEISSGRPRVWLYRTVRCFCYRVQHHAAEKES